MNYIIQFNPAVVKTSCGKEMQYRSYASFLLAKD